MTAPWRERRRGGRPELRTCVFGAWLGACLVAPNARASDPPLFLPDDRTTSALPGDAHVNDDATADGVYGRFDGRLDLGVHAGAELSDGHAAGAARVSLHYLFMAGVYVAYTDGLGGSSLESQRIASVGVDVRPAFIPRWAEGREAGPEFLDLAVDSLSLGLGAYFRQPREQSFAERRGLELSLGFGLPLAGSALGPWLGARGLLRWDDPRESGAEAARFAGLVTFGWHFALAR